MFVSGVSSMCILCDNSQKLDFRLQQDAQLGIESVGHIGKDSNNNRSK